MNVQVKQNQNTETQQERKLFVGLEQFSLVAINPTTEEINALYERENNAEKDKEQIYIDEKDGNDRIKLSFFLKALQTNRIVRKNFYITDKIRKSKDGVKSQWVNQTCESGWGASEDDLNDYFKTFIKDKAVVGKKTFREAKEGEVEVYRFFRGIMNKVRYNDSQTDIIFDFKKLLKGNWKELTSYLLNDEYCSPVTINNYIKNVDTEEGVKTYNDLYTGEYGILPGDFYNKISFSTSKYYNTTLEELKDNTEEIERLKIQGVPEALTVNDIYGYVREPDAYFKNEYEGSRWKKYVAEISGEYGCKGFYKLCPVFEYHPSMDLTASSNVIESDLSY